MEIDILEISLDILAIWHARVNLPMFLASLSRSFKSKPCDDLRLAAADSFGFVMRYSSSEGAGECFNTTPSTFCSRVSPGTGDPVHLAGVRSVRVVSQTAHGAVRKHA